MMSEQNFESGQHEEEECEPIRQTVKPKQRYRVKVTEPIKKVFLFKMGKIFQFFKNKWI